MLLGVNGITFSLERGRLPISVCLCAYLFRFYLCVLFLPKASCLVLWNDKEEETIHTSSPKKEKGKIYAYKTYPTPLRLPFVRGFITAKKKENALHRTRGASRAPPIGRSKNPNQYLQSFFSILQPNTQRIFITIQITPPPPKKKIICVC